MAENPQKEYWKRMWQQAYANVPRKIIKKRAIREGQLGQKMKIVAYKYNVPTEEGKAATLMLLLGRPMFSRYGKRKTHKLHYQAAAHGGHRPKDPEQRRKLEILAGPNGKIMAWIKLKELGISGKYEQP